MLSLSSWLLRGVLDGPIAVLGLGSSLLKLSLDPVLDKAIRKVSKSIADGIREGLKKKWLVALASAAWVSLMCFSPPGDYVWRKTLTKRLSANADRRLARQYFLENGAQQAVEENLEWSAHVKEVGKELVKTLSLKTTANLAPLNWHFLSVQQNSLWILSVPGGTILLSDNLLKYLQPTKSELAALVAYAMSPVVRRNMLQLAVYRGICLFLFTLPIDPVVPASLTASLLVGGFSLGLGEQVMSRRHVGQAEYFALALLLDDSNDYSPRALASLFRKLAVLKENVEDSRSAGIHVGIDDYRERADYLDWFVGWWVGDGKHKK